MNNAAISPEALHTLREFAKVGQGGYRLNARQADDLARAIQQALAALAAK